MEIPNQQRPKKAYTTPRLVVHGSVEQLTQGEGIRGSDDMFVFHIGRFTISVPYGTDRSS
ncbi:MAG: lasso peptide [Oscillochloris sp.]|nr:lasso peptide [Oscillochloris sp.]